jgi:hypothetical protein
VVSERDFICIFQVKRDGKGRQSAGDSEMVVCRQETIKKTVSKTVGEAETLGLQSDSNRFARRADRDNTMATEGHRYAERKNPELMSATEREKELADIREKMEELELRMRQNTKQRWVYEWPMKKLKMKWPVKELMDRRQCRLLKGWLRHTENLDGPKEMVQICEPETGRDLNELRSAEDLKNCQESREEILDCQVGKGLRSLQDLRDYQEDS